MEAVEELKLLREETVKRYTAIKNLQKNLANDLTNIKLKVMLNAAPRSEIMYDLDQVIEQLEIVSLELSKQLQSNPERPKTNAKVVLQRILNNKEA